MRRLKPISPKPRTQRKPRALFASYACRYEIDRKELEAVALAELELQHSYWREAYALQRFARESLRMNARTTDGMQNGRSSRGEDFANLRGVDELATEAQSMFPGFDFGSDPAYAIIDLIHQGALPEPTLRSDSVLRNAADYLSRLPR